MASLISPTMLCAALPLAVALASSPSALLERVRRSPALADDPAAVDELAREAEGFPPGTVRIEARLLVAEAWLHRMNRPDDAVRELREVAGDPAADPLTASLAEREIVDALTRSGRLVEAAAEARAQAGRLDAAFVRRVERRARRGWIARAAAAVVATMAALASVSVARARRRGASAAVVAALRGVAPGALGFAAFLGVAGGALANRYAAGAGAPFVALAAASLPLVLLARAWSAAGSPRTASRLARAGLCAASALAAAFLALDALAPTALEGFGL